MAEIDEFGGGRVVVGVKQFQLLARPIGDSPATGNRFHGLVASRRLEAGTQVTDFCNRGAVISINSAIHDEAAANPRSHGDVEDSINALPCPEFGFAERRDVAVVVNPNRASKCFF